MELNIKAKNVDVNQKLQGHIERKFGDLIRHIPAITNVNVELSSQATRSQSDRMVAQATLNVDGSLLRAEQRVANSVEAINLVAGVLDRRIERYKSRTYRSKRAKQVAPLVDQQAEDDSLIPDSGGTEVGGDGRLVKVKIFDMNPMTVDEAAFQMQLLGHRFFMFLNTESNEYSLLYQRDDSDLGMIQPESN